jgi:hypothetical protein
LYPSNRGLDFDRAKIEERHLMQHKNVGNLKISLPRDLIAELNLKFYDPTTGIPSYGARSLLIERLIRDWLRQEKTP